MKDIKQIYRDKTGWREVNHYPKQRQIEFEPRLYTINEEWRKFEKFITYHEFPNAPETKEGEVVEAYLQWQYKGYTHDNSGWYDCHPDIAVENYEERRQIWVAANQERNGLDLEKLGKQVDDFIAEQIPESYRKEFEIMDKQEAKKEQPKAITVEQAANEMFDRGSYRNHSDLRSAYVLGATFGANWKQRQFKKFSLYDETQTVIATNSTCPIQLPSSQKKKSYTIEEAARVEMDLTPRDNLSYEDQLFISGAKFGANLQKQRAESPKEEVSAEEILDSHAQNFGAIDFCNLCREGNITDIQNCALLSMQHFATPQLSANTEGLKPSIDESEIGPEKVLKEFAENFDGESWAVEAMEQYATIKTSSLQSLLQDKEQQISDILSLQDQLCETYDKTIKILEDKEKEIERLKEFINWLKQTEPYDWSEIKKRIDNTLNPKP